MSFTISMSVGVINLTSSRATQGAQLGSTMTDLACLTPYVDKALVKSIAKSVWDIRTRLVCGVYAPFGTWLILRLDEVHNTTIKVKISVIQNNWGGHNMIIRSSVTATD